MGKDLSTLVIIPAKNEKATVGDIIRSIKAEVDCEVVVVDDQSTDGTIEEARSAGAQILPLSLHLGAWGAMQTGLRYAENHGYQTAVTIDADGQHPVSHIRALLEPIESGEADVVIGSCTERGSAARRVAWTMLRWMSGLRIRDLTSGFRAYNRAALTLLASREAALIDHQDIAVLLLLQNAGFRIVENEVPMCPRKNGSSRIFNSWWVVMKYMLQTSILCVAKR